MKTITIIFLATVLALILYDKGQQDVLTEPYYIEEPSPCATDRNNSNAIKPQRTNRSTKNWNFKTDSDSIKLRYQQRKIKDLEDRLSELED